MRNVSYLTTPNGEELAVLPREEFEELVDAADHQTAINAYRSGRVPGLSTEETMELIAAPSPLAFWRKRAGLTQAQLAKRVGIAQAYVSNLENGNRDGDVKLWMNIAKALGLPVETIANDEA